MWPVRWRLSTIWVQVQTSLPVTSIPRTCRATASVRPAAVQGAQSDPVRCIHELGSLGFLDATADDADDAEEFDPEDPGDGADPILGG